MSIRKTQRVSDVIAEAERYRQRARVYAFLRCALVKHVKTGHREDEIEPDVMFAIAEELLVAANSSRQKAKRLMALPVPDCAKKNL